MEKLHEIKFCWAQPLPITLIYKGEVKVFTSSKARLLAESHTDMLKKLKGTDAKIISNINSIRECTQ